MRKLLLLAALLPATASASIYRYDGTVDFGVSRDSGPSGAQGQSIPGVAAQLVFDTDALTWSFDARANDPQQLSAAFAGPLAPMHELNTYGPFQMDPETGDFKLTSDLGQITGSLVLNGINYTPYKAGDFFSHDLNGSFALAGLHTDFTDGVHTWVADCFLNGEMTPRPGGATPQSSPVPEPATLLLLGGSAIALRLRRFQSTAHIVR